MRHRAPSPRTNLRDRLRPGSGRRLLVGLTVLLGLGGAAYATLVPTGGGSSDRQPAGSIASGDAGAYDGSRDLARSYPGGTPSASDRPTPSPSVTPSPTSSASALAERTRAGLASAPTSPSAPASAQASTSASASSTPADDNAPDTTLSADYSADGAATFSFSADEPASFTCSLDGAAYTACTSPTSYTDLSPGWHTFAVRATDRSGNVDPTPADTRWHVSGSSTDQ